MARSYLSGARNERRKEETPKQDRAGLVRSRSGGVTMAERGRGESRLEILSVFPVLLFERGRVQSSRAKGEGAEGERADGGWRVRQRVAGAGSGWRVLVDARTPAVVAIGWRGG
ncbi:hypothetical protein ANO11243_095020 [Dothideomycetidae sp. 11243]|nr:hypothetical protein ANO11243_095020 [fungal sp. No.11243]